MATQDINPPTVYIYFASKDGYTILDRSLKVHFGDMSRVNERVDTLRNAGKQVWLTKNIRLKGALI